MKWKIAGLVILAVLALAVASFVLTTQSTPPPVSDKVAKYKPPTVIAKPPKVVAVIGDSYSVGVGAVDPMVANGWVGQLGLNQTWTIKNFARAGTGYTASVSSDAQEACHLDYCPKYSEMIDEVVGVDPSLVLVAGGREDVEVDPVLETEAIRDFYTELKAKLPNAKIVAFNALWQDTPAPATINGISAVVRDAAQAVGGTYLSVGQPLANRPELITPDGEHPNPAGHAAIFQATLKVMQESKLASR